MGEIDTAFLERVHAGLADILASEMGSRLYALNKLCESPIEVALGLSLLFVDHLEEVRPFDPLCLAGQGELWPDDTRLLIPQYQMPGKRIDFLLRDPPIQVFIECDGHDFHERTKLQAARDRRRDRELQQTGHRVLRFTGSEIFADPVECAREVFEILSDLHMHRSLGSAS